MTCPLEQYHTSHTITVDVIYLQTLIPNGSNSIFVLFFVNHSTSTAKCRPPLCPPILIDPLSLLLPFSNTRRREIIARCPHCFHFHEVAMSLLSKPLACVMIVIVNVLNVFFYMQNAIELWKRDARVKIFFYLAFFVFLKLF